MAESTPTYKFSWPAPSGTVPITQLGFTLKFTSEDAELKFTEGLATYNTFDLSWKPSVDAHGCHDVTLENYKCLDAKTGEEMAVDVVRPTKVFRVDEKGNFVELANIDDLVETVEKMTLEASAETEEEEGEDEKKQRESFMKQYVEQSRSQTKQAVTNEVSLMWNALAQAWLDVPATQSPDNIFFQAAFTHGGRPCVKLGKSFKQDPDAYKHLVQQQITNTFALSMPEGEVPHIEVVAAALTTEFVSILEADTLRAHIADFTRVNESLFYVDDEQSSSLEVKCQRWLLAWPSNPELASEQFLQQCYEEYVQTAQATFSQIMSNLGLDDEADGEYEDGEDEEGFGDAEEEEEYEEEGEGEGYEEGDGFRRTDETAEQASGATENNQG
eukprot:TRINITY_DN1594_c0_g3_i3.p1 TRINITY_DN1594_c0_g3~~TRINITY_DN1594_c0_g3_i3.p1  ORF type:complete len:386 (+),score=114.79 TRINITY_DN1594_c0_g3_i3:80-1237(+)